MGEPIDTIKVDYFTGKVHIIAENVTDETEDRKAMLALTVIEIQKELIGIPADLITTARHGRFAEGDDYARDDGRPWRNPFGKQ